MTQRVQIVEARMIRLPYLSNGSGPTCSYVGRPITRGPKTSGASSSHSCVAHCHLGLAKLYLRMDKHKQAQEHLATATAMYRDLGMTYWLEKAEAEMRAPGG